MGEDNSCRVKYSVRTGFIKRQIFHVQTFFIHVQYVEGFFDLMVILYITIAKGNLNATAEIGFCARI